MRLYIFSLLASLCYLSSGWVSPPLRPVKVRASHISVSSNREELLSKFVSYTIKSLEDDSFVSLALKGAKKGPRGSIKLVTGRPVEIKREKKVQMTFKYHLATDLAKNWELHELKTNLNDLLLSNQSSIISEWGEDTSVIDLTMLRLETTKATFECQLSKTAKWTEGQPKQTEVILDHDRVKIRPLDTKVEFLQALKVTDTQGKPRPNMSAKLKQCQKFVEIVDKLVSDSKKPLHVVDMGCGRGYLTFSLHHHLHGRGLDAKSTGIDVRPKLVNELNGIVETLGPTFESLCFEVGTIEDFIEQKQGPLDVLIALHACDTATDDAIWAGIARAASSIIVAPCCHKEVRSQLNRHASKSKDHPYADVLRHNIYRERIAETVTDSMRALLLEYAGYQVQVFEFIGGEHTSKNVMITAVKSKESVNRDEILERLQSLAALHGISQHRLARWMDVDLGVRPPPLSLKRMPPI